MPRLEGTISITGLHPHRGLIVNLCFYPVAGPEDPAPYDGDPPAEAATDCEKVFEHVDLEKESQESGIDVRFAVERQEGHYYLQVRAIMFRAKDGKMFAQAEQFFFDRRPFFFESGQVSQVTFPVEWPAIALDDLHHYGTVSPQSQRPWWKFW